MGHTNATTHREVVLLLDLVKLSRLMAVRTDDLSYGTFNGTQHVRSLTCDLVLHSPPPPLACGVSISKIH